MDLFDKILDAPIRSSIDGLMELAHDPVLKKRKEMIYKYNELKLLGVRHLDELDEENRKGMQLLFDKNIGDAEDDTEEEGVDSDEKLEKMEKRELINTGRTFA